ncbi:MULTISPECIES: hypothetical protein [Haloferax]|uniref:Uncharacterized protein n=2 Tax=Haloferax TaxID=2251 RepID=A0A6G1Z625_9EURY|nr:MULTISPECIES: hypothetical protein [Haloferax]KAB1185837.1 hypothetical protein Hfx1149_14565 [Haloferax sp. CBA1149]KAB1187786.1 hypothetical protein Hfx1149_06950 [Haloferax sp. CBA1149]MRW80448.1 hypothetical protein [Haloferax marinisediminis]MRW81925.1 hypothetical protein [Haloferax marinisediminis]
MGLFSSRNALIGMALMVVGTLAMLPALLPNAAQVTSYALVLGAAALTYGTWLVGTSEDGRPV